MDHSPSLLDLVQRHLSPEQYAALHWEGSFRDYLALVERNPAVARNAWQRLLDMIEYHGYEQAARRGGPPRWKIFDDPFERGRDAVFGLDEQLNQLVQVFRAGAQALGPEKRVILLHGPVGSAKSTIARLLKRGLEAYSATDAGALYTFSWHLDGEVVPSPMNQDPLLLIPLEARAEVERRLNKNGKRGYRLELNGELDPVSRYHFRALSEKYKGDWSRVVEHVRVRRLLLSEKDRVEIGRAHV